MKHPHVCEGSQIPELLEKKHVYHCPEKSKETVCNTFVRPILEYSASAWDPGNVKQIEGVQRKAARFVK